MRGSLFGTMGRLALAVGAILFTLVLAEIVLRNTLIPVEAGHPMERGSVVADAEIGYRLAPNLRTSMTNGHFHVPVRTNRLGLRDEFDPNLLSPGFVAIGDSQTFGHGIRAEDTWVEQLQRTLGANVVNTGVFGYGINQYEPLLRRLHEAGVPIRVVLYAMSWNDLYSGALPPDKQIAVDGYLAPNPAYNQRRGDVPLRRRILTSNAVIWFVNRTAIGTILRAGGNRLLGLLGMSASGANDESELAAHAHATKRSLRSLKNFLDGIGARLVIVHLGNANFAMTDLWEDYHRRYSHSRFFVREALAVWCEESGIVFADAIEALEERYQRSGMQRTSLILPVDNHYNASGNEVIASVFLAALREAGLDDRSN